MSSQPINLSNFHKFIATDPQNEADRLSRNQKIYKTLGVITAIATVAILTTSLVLSLAGIVVSGPAAYILGALVLSTPLIAFGATKLLLAAQKNGTKSLKYKEIASLKTDELIKNFENSFFKDLKSTLPLSDLTNLIARFNYYINKRAKLEKDKKDAESTLTQPIITREIYCQERWINKQKALKVKMKAAFLLKIIENPQKKDLKLSSLGEFIWKSHSLHRFDKKNREVKFFTFKNKDVTTLNFSDVKTLRLAQLKNRLG